MAAAAIPLIAKAGASIVGAIFGGMRQRAQEAANENIALQQIVEGFDQAVAQIQQQVNAGQLSLTDAESEINSIWQWYWQSITPKIQPNRNGCSSGGNCPGDAMAYQSSNGAPAGYCTGTIGASCCLGCGPIRLSIERIAKVLAAGGGTAIVAPIGGNHYGLQTRVSYSVTFKPPVFSSITQQVEGSLSTLIGGGSYSGATVSGSSTLPTGGLLTGGGLSGGLVIGLFAVVLLLIALMFSRR